MDAVSDTVTTTGTLGTRRTDWTDFFTEAFRRLPIMVILRGMTPEDAVAAARTAWDSGIGLVEVTIETDRALPALEAVIRAAPDEVPVGAGTVTTPARLATAADAGARFAVAPGLDADTVQAARERDMPFLPGIATPTEAGHAIRLGVAAVKAFPAATLGPAWVRAIAAPFPELRVIATGGVTTATVPEYLRAGALAVGMGSSLATGGGLTELVTTVSHPADRRADASPYPVRAVTPPAVRRDR